MKMKNVFEFLIVNEIVKSVYKEKQLESLTNIISARELPRKQKKNTINKNLLEYNLCCQKINELN